jgi:NACHT domain
VAGWFTDLNNLGAVVELVGAVVAGGSWLLLQSRRWLRGRSRRRYARWFLDQYSTYWNPYLDKTERLRLDRTYIPLSFEGDPPHQGGLVPAAATVADRSLGSLVVLGDAGSGKTTMLKAYGVSTLTGGAWSGGSTGDVPFFVPVRLLARSLHRGGLVEHLKGEVLGAGAGFTGEEAHAFLSQVLRQHRCVVLLDGLDEVTREDYLAVRDEVGRFATGRHPELPTANARLVITCRHNNFLPIRDDWLTGLDRSIADRVYALAPLGDAEIINYLDRLQDRFARPDGPDYFMAAVRASDDILRLHRTPLVLSMSVGLYADRPFFEIPHSIAKLYDLMIREMLDRHREVNRFLSDDKLRLLREFGLRLVQNENGNGFGPFTGAALAAFARRLQPMLRNVPRPQVEAFVQEIIDHSGLLSTAAEDRYEFAHRSILEHLVADELLRSGDDGQRQIRDGARHPEWRQVVVFYLAAAHQRVVSPLLRDLAREDVVLAGECLAGADCTDEDARPILDRLAAMLRSDARDQTLLALSALLSANLSPRPTVQEAATDVIFHALTEITHEAGAVGALGGDIEGVLGIITNLAGRAGQSPMSRRLIARLCGIVPDDPRLVKPLWSLVTSGPVKPVPDPGPGTDADLADFVARLLILAMDPACFVELQQQPTNEPLFPAPDVRRRAYPFRTGVGLSTNLVTLLCWADQLKVVLPKEQRNRFLEARYTDRSAWARLEADRRRAGVPVPAMRIERAPADHNATERLTGAGLIGVAIFTLGLTVADGLSHHPALGAPLRVAVPALAAAELVLALPMLGIRGRVHLVRLQVGGKPNPYLDAYDDPGSRHWLAAGTVTATG